MIGLIYTPRSAGRGRSRPGGSRAGTKTYLGVAAVALGAMALIVRAQLAAAADVTLLGKVLNMSCYSAHETDSRVYRTCARSSAASRSPAGFLAADGKVYLLIDNSAHAARRTRFLGRRSVRVTGKLIQRGGLPMLAISALRKA